MKKINCQEAKKIPIVEFLNSKGYSPIRTRNNDCFYLSPLRDELTASFKVNIKMNVWFDYGLGIGGTLLDLGLLMYGCSLEELLEKLAEGNFSFVQQTRDDNSNSVIVIDDVKTISSYALLNYLRNRRIKPNIALRFCVEAKYTVNKKTYFAIGFKNRSGGYELRNRYFKGGSSPKDITLIINDSETLCVFEGFFDFLSYFGSKFEIDGPVDFLVLNSVAFLEKSKEIIERYNKVYLFLDNDTAGKKGVELVKTFEIGKCINVSDGYSDYKDLNEFIGSQIKNEITIADLQNEGLF